MNPLLAAIALAVVAGTVVAVASRDARVAILGAAVALIGTPVLADPLPAPLGLAGRFVGAILAAYLLWIVARDRGRGRAPSAATGGSRIGWPAETLVAASAFVVGLAAHGLGAPAMGTSLASATGFAVAALAVPAAMTGADVLRVGIGSLLLLDAALLVRTGLGGTPDQLEQLITTGAIVVVAGALATLAGSARDDGTGGFGFSLEGRRRRRREADAHRIEPRIGDLSR
ncbi:MAG TPA: hypothetical protein VIB02_06185 [Candidatus Limnocylindrales bacterium]